MINRDKLFPTQLQNAQAHRFSNIHINHLNSLWLILFYTVLTQKVNSIGLTNRKNSDIISSIELIILNSQYSNEGEPSHANKRTSKRLQRATSCL